MTRALSSADGSSTPRLARASAASAPAVSIATSPSGNTVSPSPMSNKLKTKTGLAGSTPAYRAMRPPRRFVIRIDRPSRREGATCECIGTARAASDAGMARVARGTLWRLKFLFCQSVIRAAILPGQQLFQLLEAFLCGQREDRERTARPLRPSRRPRDPAAFNGVSPDGATLASAHSLQPQSLPAFGVEFSAWRANN